MSEWKNIPKDLTKYQGFVYKITNKLNNKYYIGKKFFWSKKTLKPLKGKSRKRHFIVESDWKNYWGSSKELLKDISEYGEEVFVREILFPCETKFDCAYGELKEQIDNNVLFDDNSYNGIINVRLRKPLRYRR